LVPRSFRTSSASFSRYDSLISSSRAKPLTRAFDGDRDTLHLPDDHPGESGDRCPGRPGWVNPHPHTQHAVTGARGSAAVHELHTADHAKHVANIAAAVAAFTAIAG
jgi:hypothetical protein